MCKKWVCAAVALTLGLGVLTAVNAQVPGEDWTRIAILGINTRSVALSPVYDQDTTVFAGTQGMGIWRSVNGGTTWTQRPGDYLLAAHKVVDIAVSPTYESDGTVFAITADARIFRSTDKGGSFSQVIAVPGSLGPAVGTSIAISPHYGSDGTVWAGFDGDGLYLSTNGGTTWEQDTYSMGAFPRIYDLVPSPDYAGDGLLYVGGYSQDLGPVATRSTGGTWTARRTGLGTGSTDTVLSLAANLAGTKHLWAGTIQHGMYRTTNGGTSWTAACDGSLTAVIPSVLSLAVSHNSTPKLMEGRADRLYESTDLGIGCTAALPIGNIQAVAFEPLWDGVTFCHAFIGTPDGLFRKGCATPLGGRGPKAVSAKAVALAYGMKGAFIGSGANGLFKAQSRDLSTTGSTAMVQYNNFPNKLIPDIVAICLDPFYDETSTSTSCGDFSTLFVAANFSSAPADNGVYKSSDWGNTWTKLVGGYWPTVTVTMNDLAISPLYVDGSADMTLYAATSDGVLRWNGSTQQWIDCTKSGSVRTPAYKIGLPPTFSLVSSLPWAHTVFMADAAGVYYSTNLGTPGSWSATAYADVACNSGSTVTGFAFPTNFGLTGGTKRIFVSNSNITCSYVHTSPGTGTGNPWGTWVAVADGLPTTPKVGAYGIAAEPDFDENTSNKRLLLATPVGPYYGDFQFASNTANWTRPNSLPTLAVTFDIRGTGSSAMAGYFKGSALSTNTSGTSFPVTFTGFNSLPDDVFQTLPVPSSPLHPRDANILFASSPTMGVFISENKGISFRPWNKGGAGGPCALRDAVGLAMMKDRGGTGWDAVWAGNSGTGIKFRFIYWDIGPGGYNLDTCGSCRWQNTNLNTGRFERFTTLGTGTQYRVYAASPSPGTGIWMADPTLGDGYSSWASTSSPLSKSPSVKFGYDLSVFPTPLTSGVPVTSQSVGYQGWNYYTIQVPPGQRSLQITMTPSVGDPDLYVRFSALPSLTQWDYRPYLGGTTVETVTVNYPTPGTWYIAGQGYYNPTSTYNLVATTSMTLSPSPSVLKGTSASGKAEVNPFESVPTPKAPSAGTVWGTVNHSGVVVGTPTAMSVTWTACTPMPNQDAQTVVQLKDGTVVAGCLGDAYYSPQPDECQTTWISSTANFPGSCSYDFRDLYQVDIAPTDEADMRTDTLIAAYGTGTATSGGIWLSGDKGHHWMKISSGFDSDSQMLNAVVADLPEVDDPYDEVAPSSTTSYYSSTDGTGVYTRTLTLQPYPTVTTLSSYTGDAGGGGSITVTGTGFNNTCPTGTDGDCLTITPVVLFGDTEAATTWVGTTSLTATVPAHAAGDVRVTVRNPDTRQAVSGRIYSYTCTIPAAPTGVSATAGCTGNSIAWTNAPTATSHNVLRGTTCGTILTTFTGVTTPYNDTTAVVGTTYNYWVVGVNTCGTSADSSCATAARLAIPAAPTGVTATAGCTGNSVAWTNSPTATSHNVLRGTTCGSVLTSFTGVTTPYNDTTAVAGTTYNYWVVGVNTCGTSANSSCATAARLAVPEAPTGVTATAGCTGNSIAWTNSPTATSHNVLRGTTCGTVLTTFTGVTTPYNDTSAVAGTTYNYWVVGMNTCGTSTNSSCATAARLAVPAPPGAPTFAGVACSTLTVNWTAVSGANQYDVYRKLGACGTGAAIATNLVFPTFNDSGLSGSTQYSYYIVAKNSCGSSADGTCASQTTTSCATPPEIAPGTTPATAQGWTSKTNHTWPVSAEATSYSLYRGIASGLPKLLDTQVDSCTAYTGATNSATVNDDPAPGAFYWYLVTGSNANGEGSAGGATAGDRVLNTSGSCP